MSKTRRAAKNQQFSFRAPGALSVQLVGDFTHWQKQPVHLKKESGGIWRAAVLLEPGTYHYRFVVDGQWHDDPDCTLRVPNPFGTENMIRNVASDRPKRVGTTTRLPITNQLQVRNNKYEYANDRDLTKEPPHSPRERIGGFAIASRTVDKCRASLTGTLGEYHYDCPLDNVLFTFKGINGDQFKAAVRAAKTYEEIGDWLQVNGTKKTPAEIKAWSDKVEAQSMINEPAKRAYFIENCTKLGLNPETSTTFDWLEADDDATFAAACGCAA